MRKIFYRAVLCALCMLVLATNVMAASSVSASLSAGSTSVTAGSQVTLTVSANATDCGAGGIELSYDTAVFELVSGKWLLSNTFMADFSTSSKDGVFAFADNTDISGDVFEFVLKVKSNAALGSYSVSVSFAADSTTKTASKTIKVVCDHSYSSETTKKATCTAKGEKKYTCSKCGDSYTEEIAKKSHSYDSGTVTTEATCSAKGVKTYTCSSCGKEKNEEIAKKSHSYGAGTVTKEPTCTENGESSFSCSVCGESKTETVNALGHSYDGDCDETCNTCGEMRTVEHFYDGKWSSDESGHWHACTLCGEGLERQSHNYGEGLLDELTGILTYTCAECGYVFADGNDISTEPPMENSTAPSENPQETTIPSTTAPETPDETQNPSTQPTEPDEEPVVIGTDFPWWIILAVLLVISVGFNVYLLICLFASKKTGKFAQ